MQKVWEGVYLVGGPNLSDPNDCLVYLVDMGVPVLIDCGAGKGWPSISANIKKTGMDPANIHTLILTHCHVDHIGALAQVHSASGCEVVAHNLDADAIETGDHLRTASSWYGIELGLAHVDKRICGAGEDLQFPDGKLKLIHTPGHTPGSMAVVCERGGQRILFGQDIHGPFDNIFLSDISMWRSSMAGLLGLECDILCEGHFGIYEGKRQVRRFIEDQLERYSYS